MGRRMSVTFLSPSEMNCTAEQFSCITGGCVPQQDRCDGKPDCKDGTDEYNCRK